MAKLVDNVIENIQEPFTIKLTDSFSVALEKMLENDFSQLPVVNEQNQPIGFVTYQSITRTLIYRATPSEELSVADVYEEIDKTRIFQGDESLSDMLDRLRDANAILFVDAQGQLIGIFTAADSTEYLRARAEDLLYVQDIESTIRDLIRFIFQQGEDEPDNEKLSTAIKKATKKIISKKDYTKALRHYLGIVNNGDLDKPAMEQSYEILLGDEGETKTFSKLTLGDYVALLLDKDQQSQFEQLFGHSPEQFRKLLEAVRDIRNDLAHLREINPTQRDQLLHCKKLLDRVSTGIPVDWQKVANIGDIQKSQAEYQNDATQLAPTDEEIILGESRYSPLADWLNSQPGGTDLVRLTFEQIEKLIGGTLPDAAYEHRSWWTNDAHGHPYSQSWLEVGWRVGYRNIAGRIITFVRIKGREKAYIDFFGPLLHRVHEDTNVPVKDASPDGSSWIVVVQETQLTGFTFAFTRRKRFRAELYIDTGNQETTKQIFDRLYAKKDQIESITGPLNWERLDEKRASRIALYHSGHITDPEPNLEVLRSWAVESMDKLYNTFGPLLQEVMSEVL
jgi:CBS domain-containing protein